MESLKVTTKDTIVQRKGNNPKGSNKKKWVPLIIGAVVVLVGLLTFKMVYSKPGNIDSLEVSRVLKAQESIHNFGILVPASLPDGFYRDSVDVKANENAPYAVPAIDILYTHQNGKTIFIREWIPANYSRENIMAMDTISTRWGTGKILNNSTEGGIILWTDIGPLRVNIVSSSGAASVEQVLNVVNTFELVSERQTNSFVSALPASQQIVPPGPLEIVNNGKGIQEVNLTITPGGYSPMRFSVKRGLPVRINFRAQGTVSCGNTLIFPDSSGSSTTLKVTKEQPVQVLEFTPVAAGDISFHCLNNCYRGFMTVR
jgi:hypothetical protein